MSKIVQTSTEFVCLDGVLDAAGTSAISHYSSNTTTSVAQSYGLIPGIAYSVNSTTQLELISGIPNNVNMRIFNTMSAANLLVQMACAPNTPGTSVILNLSVSSGGCLTVPAAWQVSSSTIKVGQASDLLNATVDTAMPHTTPTTCAIFWWL